MTKNVRKKLATKLLYLANTNKQGFSFSACIELKGKLYFAVNKVTSKNDPTAHAEIQAIRLACKREKKYELKRAKIYCSGEPCPMCLTGIAWAGIKEIYYVNPYYMATKNNRYYDRPSEKVNQFLKLKRKLIRIKR